ncbi:uncharacterized protein LOC129587255 [Paramacrobiotus metropolitanus]|uniref:uncharacterized protein LOC129587255 n=1 Tax=Paramacrobiotus metropolitanus TaxID=2943436 RepID=UPI0024463D19|nr:uncharacterized protein LOC129587255 [Paramacrobiotus metropolitanus]
MELAVALPRFRRLLASVCEQGGWMSYQNTVTVLREDGAWWLGCIQDFNEHSVLVHFNASTVPPGWIPAGRVWPHFSLDSRHTYRCAQPGMRVYVTLRDEDHGPFRFRPATWLDSGSDCRMHYIVLDDVDSAGAVVMRVEAVDFCQVSSSLPPSEMNLAPPTYGDSLTGQANWTCYGTYYTKMLFTLPGAQLLLREAADARRIIQRLRQGIFMLGYTTPDQCRFHLHTASDCCMVIFHTYGLRLNCDTEQESVDRLQRALQTHIAHLASGESACSSADDEQVAEDVGIQHLPHCILSEAFSHLELHTQANVRRVCALWQLLTVRRTLEHVTLTFAACTSSYRNTCAEESCSSTGAEWDGNEEYCFRVAALLNRHVTSTTKSLTVSGTNWCRHNAEFLLSFLTIRHIRLPLIIVRDFTNDNFAYTVRSHRFHYAEVIYKPASQLWEVCEAVLLLNGRVSWIFRHAMGGIFLSPGSELPPLPVQEQELMNPYLRAGTRPLSLCLPAKTAPLVLSVDALQIAIPRVRLPWRQGYEPVLSRLMWAVNENCPPVAEAVYDKMKAVHARWVRTLVYPEEWETIRCFLHMYNGFSADGAMRTWTGVDLRAMDVGQLSKLAVLGLSEVFGV